MGSESELSRREKRQAIEKALEQNLPALLLGFCISVSITLSLALIGLQIYSITQQLELFYIGTGIWVGGLVILANLMHLILMFQRYSIVYWLWFIAQIISVLSLVANAVINTVAIQLLGCSANANSKWPFSSMIIIGTVTKVFTFIAFYRVNRAINQELAVYQYRKATGDGSLENVRV